MANTTLYTIYQDMSQAAIATEAVNGFYMVDESEINELKPIAFPIIVAEVPNSSVSNINKAWEEHEMSVFCLLQTKTTYSTPVELQLYDDAIEHFTNFISELMGQREGDYVVDQESFKIERLKNYSNHMCIGVNVKFTLLAASKLQYYNTPAVQSTTWSNSTNLIALFNASKNLTITSNSINWTPELPVGSPLSITELQSDSLPYYSDNRFTFSGSPSGLKLSNLTFTSEIFRWEIYLKISVPSSSLGDMQTVFKLSDPSSGDTFLFGIRVSDNQENNQDGQPFYQVDTDNDGDTSLGGVPSIYVTGLDLEPLSETVICIGNGANTKKIFLRLYNPITDTMSIYVADQPTYGSQFSNANLFIGTSILEDWNFEYRPFHGTISHIAIFDDLAINDEGLHRPVTVARDLMNL